MAPKEGRSARWELALRLWHVLLCCCAIAFELWGLVGSDFATHDPYSGGNGVCRLLLPLMASWQTSTGSTSSSR